jgi:hypothetical protein
MVAGGLEVDLPVFCRYRFDGHSLCLWIFQIMYRHASSIDSVVRS